MKQLLLRELGVGLCPVVAFCEIETALGQVLGVGCYHLLVYVGLLLHLFLLLLLAWVLLILAAILEHVPEKSTSIVGLPLGSLLLLLSRQEGEEAHSSVDEIFNSRLSRKFDSIHLKIVLLILDHSYDFDGSLFNCPDFEEGMDMFSRTLTLLAEIEIGTNCTFISDSFDVLPPASIAGDSLVLVSLLFLLTFHLSLLWPHFLVLPHFLQNGDKFSLGSLLGSFLFLYNEGLVLVIDP